MLQKNSSVQVLRSGVKEQRAEAARPFSPARVLRPRVKRGLSHSQLLQICRNLGPFLLVMGGWVLL